MAKDPAVLLYTSDFLTGTMTMTNEQVGKYIRLLCLQHQKGELSEKDMINICETHEEDIFGKFMKNDSGNFINVRMLEETERRNKYCQSRATNRKKKEGTYVKHMETETEDIKKGGKGGKKKFIPPSVDDVTAYFKLKGYTQEAAVRAFDYYTELNWHDRNGDKVQNWKGKMISNWFKPENLIPATPPDRQAQIEKATQEQNELYDLD